MRAVASTLAALLLVGAAVTPARAETPDIAAQRAEALAEEAYERYAQRRDAEAIELYTRAYEAAPAARMLLDLAEIYDARLHDRERASDYYLRYLAAPDAEADLSAYARRKLAALAATPRATSPRPGPAAALLPPPKRAEPPPLRAWGLVVGGVGLAGIALGTVTALVAKSKNDEAQRSCVGQACADPRALTLTDEAVTAARVADVAFIAGGVLLAVGGALILVAPTRRGVTVSGTFR